MRAIHAHVSGVVHGVGFRFTVERAARRLNLAGWVKNTDDGRVEVFAQGGDADIDTLVEILGTGPSGARVAGVELVAADPDPSIIGFQTRF